MQPLLDRLRREGVPDWRDALRGGALTPEQAAEIEAAEAAVAGVLVGACPNCGQCACPRWDRHTAV
ncbi:acyl-CoA dehydrogenase [Bordetella pertussis]|nr:acyl-CoA dehydrogenase [Bordetella pertussis]